MSNKGRNDGRLNKSVEAFVPSRFISKAALMTTNCFGAVTHTTERRFQFRLINRRSQHVLSCSRFSFDKCHLLSGLTGFNRRHKPSTLLLTSQNLRCSKIDVLER